MKIMINIIYFFSWYVHFPKCFDYDVLTNSFGLEKTQSLLYTWYSFLYEQLNNPMATKEPNLVGIIKWK